MSEKPKPDIRESAGKGEPMSTWMKEWGQFIILLLAIGGTYISLGNSLRGEIAENRNSLRGEIAENRNSLRGEIIENRRAIEALAREVYELRGELKGRDLIAGGNR